MNVSKDHSIAFAWVGMIAVIAFLIAWAGAAAADTAWQFGVNNLSDFGVSDTDAKLYFNYGCIITGILLLCWGLGRIAFVKSPGHVAGGVLIAFGSIGLIGVGMFNSDTGDWHLFFAVTAGLFFFLAIAAVAVGNWMADRKVFAGIGLVITIMLFAMFLAYDIAMLEAYGIILAMIWVLVESTNMILSHRKGI